MYIGKRTWVNLGGAYEDLKGYITVDIDRAPNVDVVCNLEYDWPFKPETVEHFRAKDLVEHLKDALHTMQEAWRCLKPFGTLEIYVPTTDSRAAFQDPTHKSFWNKNSFTYYVWPWNARYNIQCNFKIVSIQQYDYSDVPMGQFVHVMLQKLPMWKIEDRQKLLEGKEN